MGKEMYQALGLKKIRYGENVQRGVKKRKNV